MEQPKDEEGRTPIHMAARAGDASILRILLGAFPGGVHDEDENGRRPLHSAIRCGNSEAVRILLSREDGAQLLEPADADGRTPLHHAMCTAEHDQETVSMLLDVAGSRFESLARARDRNGDTPLHVAVSSPAPEVRLAPLLARLERAFVSVPRTARREEIRATCLDAENAEGQTAEQLAQARGHAELAAAMRRVRLLALSRGASATA